MYIRLHARTYACTNATCAYVHASARYGLCSAGKGSTGAKGQCLLFNKKTGCRNAAGKCPHGGHFCTVCGSTSHGASFHTPPAPKRDNKRSEAPPKGGEMSGAAKAEMLSEERNSHKRQK